MSDADSDSFPIMNRPLSPDTIVAYRLRRDSDKHISTGKVKQAGFYVILVTNESGHEEFVFYDELMAVQESIYMSIDPNKLCVGCIIRYRLLPAQNPTTPDRLWRGKILSLHIGMPDSLDVALVENLDIGYCAGTEFVLLSQIQSIETSAPVHGVHLLTVDSSNGDG